MSPMNNLRSKSCKNLNRTSYLTDLLKDVSVQAGTSRHNVRISTDHGPDEIPSSWRCFRFSSKVIWGNILAWSTPHLFHKTEGYFHGVVASTPELLDIDPGNYGWYARSHLIRSGFNSTFRHSSSWHFDQPNVRRTFRHTAFPSISPSQMSLHWSIHAQAKVNSARTEWPPPVKG